MFTYYACVSNEGSDSSEKKVWPFPINKKKIRPNKTPSAERGIKFWKHDICWIEPLFYEMHEGERMGITEPGDMGGKGRKGD